MPFNFLDNAICSGMCPTPDQTYRELKQAFISQQWENTTARHCIEEQDLTINNEFGPFSFHKIEAWLNYVVGQTSSGLKNGDDFVQLSFECIGHLCLKGRYYKFDNNYWISYFTDEYDSVDKTLAVRRCNNWLKMIDPENGEIYQIPCVVNYEMSSPSIQVSRYVITPNNHATVIVQGNKDTNRLFKLNTRFILGGRPFKLYGYQNAILDDLISEEPSIMYLDLFLDEIHANDDLENQIADNGEYKYTIKISADDMELEKGSTGEFSADVCLNGIEVQRRIVWSSNSKNVKITEDGKYTVNGNIGSFAVIRATLENNDKVFDEIVVGVTEKIEDSAVIILDPDFSKIREYETRTFDMSVIFNNDKYTDIENSEISLSPDSIVLNNKNLLIIKNKNNYSIICNKFTKDPVNLYLYASNTIPAFEVQSVKEIKLVSMLG